MTWVPTRNGYVNLATATAIRDHGEVEYLGMRLHKFTVTDQLGHEHELVPENSEGLEQLVDPVVPAHRPINLHIISYKGPEYDLFDPETDDGLTTVHTYPVIAWRLSRYDEPEPILAGHGPVRRQWQGKVVIDLPDGRVHDIHSDGISYHSLDDARNALIEEQLQKPDQPGK